MKNFLIIVGPQGSGNHLWSKIFSLHESVFGWKNLLTEFWIGHDKEPFADCWENPELLKEKSWECDYYVSGVSIPFMLNGTPTIPKLEEFINNIPGKVTLAVIGRDKNILSAQQERVRGGVTYSQFLNVLDNLINISPTTFLSFELLHLYKKTYLEHISKVLNFPVDYNNPRIEEIFLEDSNKKYINSVKHYWVDELAKKSSKQWK